MSRYLYITDVYCPWCYAFGLVFDKVLARYPMPVSVLCGELVSPGYTIDDMVMEMPNIRAFFKRLQDTAGRGVGKAYLDLLEPGKGSMSMDSRAMSVPVAALRRLDPGREREQIEALQKAFYQDGRSRPLCAGKGLRRGRGGAHPRMLQEGSAGTGREGQAKGRGHPGRLCHLPYPLP